MTTFLHAPNIHQGGGKTLLNELLANLPDNAFCILDERLASDVVASLPGARYVKPSISSRLRAEFWLYKTAGQEDTVICFGNLPPLFPSSAKVVVFLQNRLLFGATDLNDFPNRTKLRICLERFWLRWRMKSRYKIVVQSTSMQIGVFEAQGRDSHVVPFLPSSGFAGTKLAPEDNNSRGFDFVYVASAEPHKNHKNLLEAWVVMAKLGVRPSLALTICERSFPEVVELIERRKSEYQLSISNLGALGRGDVGALYANSKALIFPSMLESYGLPLVEANEYGLPIIASELDFVRDVVDPVQTFDPSSPRSIARAVLRHLGVPCNKTQALDARGFFSAVLALADS